MQQPCSALHVLLERVRRMTIIRIRCRLAITLARDLRVQREDQAGCVGIFRQQRIGRCSMSSPVLVAPLAVGRGEPTCRARLVRMLDDRVRHGVAVRLQKCLRELVAYFCQYGQHIAVVPVRGRHTGDACRVFATDLRRDVV